jgi:HPt (histidine-containing phosphotransfer) domain-containing protein
MGEEPLDRARLLELSGGLEGFSEELVQMFLEDAGPRLEVIRAAIDAADADLLSREAHSLKGSSGNVGATGVERLSRELEEAARSGDVRGAAHLVDKLDAELRQLGAALEAGLS